jgi:Cys-rich repeat protein
MTHTKNLVGWMVLAGLACAAACSGSDKTGPGGVACVADSECPAGQVCSNGTCTQQAFVPPVWGTDGGQSTNTGGGQNANTGGTRNGCAGVIASDDICAQGCQRLDACDLCITSALDQCVSVTDCAAGCRTEGTRPAMQCIVNLNCSCDQSAIDACLRLPASTGGTPSTGGVANMGGRTGGTTSTGGRATGGIPAQTGGRATGGAPVQTGGTTTTGGRATGGTVTLTGGTPAAGGGGTGGVACTCSSGQRQCNGTSAINTCPDGCQWTSTPCATVCLLNGYVNKSSGCAIDGNTGQDVCWCPSATNHDVMLLSFVDSCNDGLVPTVQMFDTTLSTSWTSFTLPAYNQFGYWSVDCVTGDQICFGAWQGSGYWGCGPSCSYPCTSCCRTCGSVLIATEALGC